MSYKRVLTVTLSRCRGPLLWVAAFSLVINILMLTSSLYMMQVYDRVIGSGSLGTLLFLTLAAAGALGLIAGLGLILSHVLSRLGARSHRRLLPPPPETSLAGGLGGRNERTHPLPALGTLRCLFSGGGN